MGDFIKPQILTTAINEDDGSASLDQAMSVAGFFELAQKKAKAIAAEVGEAVSTWRNEATKNGIGRTETEPMATAFEQDYLRRAQGKE